MTTMAKQEAQERKGISKNRKLDFEGSCATGRAIAVLEASKVFELQQRTG